MKLLKTFKTEILFQIFSLDFNQWIKAESENSQYKWEKRCERIGVQKDKLKHYSIPTKKYLPANFSILLRKFTALCTKCKKPYYPEHLEQHGVHGVQIKEIFEEFDRIQAANSKDKRKSRTEIMTACSNYIQKVMIDVDKVLNEYAENFKSTS